MKKKPTLPTYMFVFRDPLELPDRSPEEMQKHFEKWLAWVEQMKSRGQYLAGEPLEPAPAKVMRGARGRTVSDGPFVEAKEIVGGFMLIRAKNLAAAQRIARACPGYEIGGSVEIRQVMEFMQ